MSPHYLLNCPGCDQGVQIETRQAGQQIECESCGQSISLGTLRDIKNLPQVGDEDSQAETKTATSWSQARRIVFVIGLLILAFGSVWGAVSLNRASQFDAPRPEYNLSPEQKRAIDALTPAQMLAQWGNLPFEDTEVWEEPKYLLSQQTADQTRLVGYLGLGIAAFGLLLLFSVPFVRF